jgi:BirA family transcriptional regulator, biotin operon repressor / biotin---[acetyl-CoA-carboxylase] ligase
MAPATVPIRARAARAAKDSTPLVAQVFGCLADGSFHSGEELARTLRVSRSAIWKAARTLRDLGVTLHAVRNRGYCLVHGGEPLDPDSIRARLAPDVRDRISCIETVWSIGSTNSALLERPNPDNGSAEVFFAEYQTTGRGRRGRAWLAPPGGAICMSVSWTFREVPHDLGALGLVIGVCTLRALRELRITDVALKWPNDLLSRDCKLGGVLIELRAESTGPACVVIGVGLNVALGAAVLEKIADSGTAATDLRSVSAGAPPARNAIAAAIVTACVRGLIEFERAGLKPFIDEWRAADALRGRPVSVSGGEAVARGVARGIDMQGALVVETPQGIKRFISGDVTVRS